MNIWLIGGCWVWLTSRPTSGALQEGFGFEVSIPPLEISAFFQRCHCRALIAGTKKFFIYIVSRPLDGMQQIKYKVFPSSPGLHWSFLTSQWLLLLLPAPDRAPENIVKLLEPRWYASMQRFFPLNFMQSPIVCNHHQDHLILNPHITSILLPWL